MIEFLGLIVVIGLGYYGILSICRIIRVFFEILFGRKEE